MEPSKIDAIISAWQEEGEILQYSQIKKHLADKGIIKKSNDRSLSRWLKKLVQEGTLKKGREGYSLQMKPKEYQVFDYLNELRERYSNYIYEGEVGGFISHVCASTYLNFDETLLQRPDEKLAFDIISVRLGELFWALFMLRNDVIKRRCGLSQLSLSDEVVRETLFGLLNRSIGEHHATEDLVGNYLKYLRAPEERAFNEMWKVNKPKNNDYFYRLEHDFFFDIIEEQPKIYKTYLKKEAALDIEKYSIEELIEKFVQIQKWIHKNHEQEMEKKHFAKFTKEEMELENNYRQAILVKMAECIKALGTSTEDFGIILTRHPRTMNQYFTPEHLLYETMIWARAPPEEEIFKKFWKEQLHEEKTFEGMVADRLSYYNNLNLKILKSLGSIPWVKRELSKFGSFDKILRIYREKRKERLKEQARSSREFLGGLKGLQEGRENLERE